MNILRELLCRKDPSPILPVDFTKRPLIPHGVEKILIHRPAGAGKQSLDPSRLELRPMPRGVSYADYVEMNPDVQFADASVLDALIHALVGAECRLSEHLVEEYIGHFAGQIFFLGTQFIDKKGTPYVAYFNWKTHYPALRYVCPVHHPVNHDVNCCACVLLPG